VHRRWAMWLNGEEKGEEAVLRRLRLCTRTGRPAGSETFVKRLERLLGRRLRPLPIGRPRRRPRKSKNG
ncbi:MAG: hypothetical protein WBF17_09340, partial [Phycisphaerae bacterium]